MALDYDYKIAAGYDQSAGLVNIQTIIPASDKAFPAPQAMGSYVPGISKVKGDGTIVIEGYPSITWLFKALTRAQYRYLQTTYCNSAYSGKVTIRTVTDNNQTYSNLNAVMVLPFHADVEFAFTGFLDVAVRMTRLYTAS